MKEKIYKIKIMDILLEAVLFDEAFHLKPSGEPCGVMSRIKHIHKHTTYEIFFVFDGTLCVHDTAESVFCPQQAVIIPPNHDHYTVSHVKTGYCFYFSVEKSASTNGNLFESVCEKLSAGITSFELKNDAAYDVLRFSESIRANESDEKITHLLYFVFANLFENISPSHQTAKNKPDKNGKYIHIIDLYLNDFENQIKLSELANKLYLCPKQVSRIIRKEYGCSLSEIVNHRKLTAASTLLKHTNLPVAQIAETVGYDYENYFYTLFKKAFGVTPLQYRKEQRKG